MISLVENGHAFYISVTLYLLTDHGHSAVGVCTLEIHVNDLACSPEHIQPTGLDIWRHVMDMRAYFY